MRTPTPISIQSIVPLPTENALPDGAVEVGAGASAGETPGVLSDPSGRGVAGRALVGAFVGGVTEGWLPGVAGGGSCACTTGGTKKANAMKRTAREERRRRLVMEVKLKLLEFRQSIHQDRAGRMSAVVVHAVDRIRGLGGNHIGNARGAGACLPGGAVLRDGAGG